jgi:hypothetical protein
MASFLCLPVLAWAAWQTDMKVIFPCFVHEYVSLWSWSQKPILNPIVQGTRLNNHMKTKPFRQSPFFSLINGETLDFNLKMHPTVYFVILLWLTRDNFICKEGINGLHANHLSMSLWINNYFMRLRIISIIDWGQSYLPKPD